MLNDSLLSDDEEARRSSGTGSDVRRSGSLLDNRFMANSVLDASDHGVGTTSKRGYGGGGSGGRTTGRKQWTLLDDDYGEEHQNTDDSNEHRSRHSFGGIFSRRHGNDSALLAGGSLGREIGWKPPPNPKTLKAQRRKKLCVGAMVCVALLVVVAAAVMLFVVPKVIQGLIDDSGFEITTVANLTNPSFDRVELTVDCSVATSSPLQATLVAASGKKGEMRLAFFSSASPDEEGGGNGGGGEWLTFGRVAIPHKGRIALKAGSGQHARLSFQGAAVRVTDKKSWDAFVVATFQQADVKLRFRNQGGFSVQLGGWLGFLHLEYHGLSISKTDHIAGMGGLPGVKILNYDAFPAPDSGTNGLDALPIQRAIIHVFNPSGFSVQPLGVLSAQTVYRGMSMGHVRSVGNVSLVQGSNILTVWGPLNPSNLTLFDQAMADFLTGGFVQVELVLGNHSYVPNVTEATAYPWVDPSTATSTSTVASYGRSGLQEKGPKAEVVDKEPGVAEDEKKSEEEGESDEEGEKGEEAEQKGQRLGGGGGGGKRSLAQLASRRPSGLPSATPSALPSLPPSLPVSVDPTSRPTSAPSWPPVENSEEVVHVPTSSESLYASALSAVVVSMALHWPTGRVNMTTETIIDVADLAPNNGVLELPLWCGLYNPFSSVVVLTGTNFDVYWDAGAAATNEAAAAAEKVTPQTSTHREAGTAAATAAESWTMGGNEVEKEEQQQRYGGGVQVATVPNTGLFVPLVGKEATLSGYDLASKLAVLVPVTSTATALVNTLRETGYTFVGVKGAFIIRIGTLNLVLNYHQAINIPTCSQRYVSTTPKGGVCNNPSAHNITG